MREMADAEDRAPHFAQFREVREDEPEERSSAHVRYRFRAVAHDGSEPRAEPARENQGVHREGSGRQDSAPRCAKWKGITRPSRPASAWHTELRRRGSTMNMMTPPPPAPETLPAWAPAARAASKIASIPGLETEAASFFFASQEPPRTRANSPSSPVRSNSFILTASSLSRCIAWSDSEPGSLACTTCSSMMRADSRERPVWKSTRETSSSFTIQSFTRRGFTITRSPRLNSMKLKPPNAAAYWSCFP